LFRLWNTKNRVAQMEQFQDDFDELIKALKNVKFL
jgi:hypothetical protein